MFAPAIASRFAREERPARRRRARGILCPIAAVTGVATCASVIAAATPGMADAATARGQAGFRPVLSQSLTVTTLSDFGPGSLRSAIETADAASAGTSSDIGFSVSGTITLVSALPAIARDVTIDGTSAPTYAPGGPPIVGIDCAGHAGLQFAAGSADSQLLGVAVDNAGGDGVTLKAGSITLNDDYIGLDLTGAAAGNQGDGVYVSSTSSGNLIGLNSSGDSGVVANVISGNGGSGLVLSGSSGNTVAANRIGTNAAGTSAIANGGNGIWITHGAHGNEIGGTSYVNAATGQANNPTGSKGTVPAVFVVPPLGNLISGNAANGVLIDTRSRDNVLNGNFVGTAADGDAAVGNGGDGVFINGANSNSLVGCKFVNNPFVYYNVLSGNGKQGLQITNSNNSKIQGNFFGVGANNTAAVGNKGDGILINGSSVNTVVGGVIPLGNVSGDNTLNGIDVAGTASRFITFNTFGGLLAFGVAAPNGHDGLLVTSTGGHNVARTNVFSGNAGNGIELAGHATGVTLDPNIAGLNTKGDSALPNGGEGVLIDGSAHHNTVGGTRVSVIPQNTFSGNDRYGLVITGSAYGNRVFDTFIGSDVLGMKAVPNHKGGVLVSGHAHGNWIGGLSKAPVDLISGNTGDGVSLSAGTRRNHVCDNYIGLDRLGRSLPNSGRAVNNRGHQNQVKGNKTHPRG
jgi:parallel beta-helix repeat protein